MENQPSNPSFVYRSGDSLQHPTFILDNAYMYGFFVKGQLNKLQNCINQELNAVSNGNFNFKPLSDYVMITFTQIEKAYSTYPQDYIKGWGSELDVGIWVPVGNIEKKNGKEYLNEIFWYNPYIWVDSPIAMIAGRDIYGFPKNLARFEFPSHQTPDNFKLTINSHKDYNPDNEVSWNELLCIQNLNPGKSPIEKWDNFADALKGIFELADGAQLFRPDMEATQQIIELLLKPQIPQIFLKQMPDGDGQKAVYQALMSAPAKVDKFHKGGLLLGDYELDIKQVATAPIAEELGLELGRQKTAFSFWINFDFSLPPAKVLYNNSYIPKKKKIAILGGGVSACTAAFALTSQPGWQDKYDITLYQLGWRIGGKGASGRNSKIAERIEEHGLHIWFGFYRNAFKCIQEAYDELERPPGNPLQTWRDAFHEHSYVVHMEHIEGKWIPWPIDFPIVPGDPSKGAESVTPWNMAITLFSWVRKWIGDMRSEIKNVEDEEKAKKRAASHPISFKTRLKELTEWLEDEIEETSEEIEDLLTGITAFINNLPEEINEHSDSDDNWLKKILEEIKEWLEEEAIEFLNDHTEIRRLFILIDLGITVMLGMFRDDIYKKGFNVINDRTFRQWLRENGANEHFTVKSSTVTALYDLIFAYEDGDVQKANAEAGTLLRGMLRLGTCYKGSIMWKMQAGMGDTIFTPYYEVLKKRGVKFEFFHEVDSIQLDPKNPKLIDKIQITRQVELKNKNEEYQPLVDVKGIGCWPSEPLYKQIEDEQAQLLIDNNIDLENFWTRWPTVYEEHFGKPLPKVTLNRGEDFDLVINGISIAALPFICPQLLEQSPTLKACHDNVKTVVTQAYQLWTNPTLPELGWEYYSNTGEQPVMTAWTEPLDTWAAMNQLLDKEDWSKFPIEPKNVAYFCGAQPVVGMPPREDHDFPIKAKAQAKQNAIEQMNHQTFSLWPDAATPEQFNWDLLTDPENRQGEDRFNSQYWRSNTSPTERYVLSVVNSSKYRINTKLNDFENIYFTGDWIKTGINAGCVEAAMAGLQTSRAICGYPEFIYGESDFGKIPTTDED